MNDRNLAISVRARDSYELGEPVRLTVEVENRGNEPLRLLGWGTPFEEEFTASFLTVKRDGETLPYDGKLVKRGDPSGEDYLTIEPGGTAETSVDVSAGYPIDRPGEYTVAVDANASDAFTVSEGEGEAARSREQHEPLSLSSPTASFTVLSGEEPRPTDGERARTEQPQAEGGQQFEEGEGEGGEGEGGAIEPNLIGGTAEQQEETRIAHQNAQSIASLAASRLVAEEVDALYATWFGEFDQNRYEAVTRHYEQIDGALTTRQLNYNLTGEGCKPGIFAYTYFGHDTVWLCSAYMEAPETGSDSKFGTLVHEWSHAICETQDHVYGESACENLAATEPEKAVTNADSHEYFAEHVQ